MNGWGPKSRRFIGGLGVGVHNIYFFICYLGRKDWGIYLGRRYGLSNPASVVRLVVSPTGKKGGVFELQLGGVGFERS